MTIYNEKKEEKEGSSKEKEGQFYLEKTLFEARTVLIFGEINMELSKVVAGRLMALAHASSDPIRVIVNSPGGHVEAGDTIYDMLKFIGCPIFMIGTGWVASIAALFYLAAPKENRFSLPNTRFLLHQPLGGMRGSASDMEIQAKEIIKMRERLNRIISAETGTSFEQVSKDTDRDYWLTPEEAKKYGIVGKIIHSINEVK